MYNNLCPFVQLARTGRGEGGSVSNLHACQRFCCSKKVEQHRSNAYFELKSSWI